MGGVQAAIADRVAIGGNPAALAISDEQKSVFLTAPGYARDIHSTEQLEDKISNVKKALNTFNLNGNIENQQVLETATRDLNGLHTTDTIHLASGLAFPNLPVSAGAYINSYYWESIKAQKTADSDFTQTAPQLNTDVEFRGLVGIETGVTLAQTYMETSGLRDRLSVGIAPKLVSFRSYYFREDATEVDLNDTPKKTVDTGMLNMDVGIIQAFNYTWKLGIVAQNIHSESVRFSGADTHYEVEPAVRVGISNRLKNWLLAADLDITKNLDISGEQNQQMNAGFEYRGLRFLDMRFGISHQLKDSNPPIISGGFGIYNRLLRLDAFYYGNQEKTLVGTQLSVRF